MFNKIRVYIADYILFLGLLILPKDIRKFFENYNSMIQFLISERKGDKFGVMMIPWNSEGYEMHADAAYQVAANAVIEYKKRLASVMY